jgi:lysozyme family protein
MATVPFSSSLKKEYDTLFNTCIIRQQTAPEVQGIADRLVSNSQPYRDVGTTLGIPWFFIAVIHNMESSLNFKAHLHNGDPLTARTVQEPKGRPKNGQPPFTWEESAMDALTLKGLSSSTDWSLAGTLYQLERYNGFGYRLYHPHVLSPYLWCYSNHYTSGKYVKDGVWSDTAASKQCGAAVLLRRLAEMGQIEFADQIVSTSTETAAPLICSYTSTKPDDPVLVAQGKDLQNWLNTYPGIFLKPDGVPGSKTSEAFKKVTGHYLPGDPRNG